MSYRTAYPSWDCPAVVCHMFLHSFICALITAFTWLSKVWTSQLSIQQCFFYLSWTSPGAGFHFWKGTYNFQNCLICIGVCTIKCTEKRFIPFTPTIFPLNLSPMQNLKEALNMSPGIYCIIRLSENMRLSAFKSPLFYPSSWDPNHTTTKKAGILPETTVVSWLGATRHHGPALAWFTGSWPCWTIGKCGWRNLVPSSASGVPIGKKWGKIRTIICASVWSNAFTTSYSSRQIKCKFKKQDKNGTDITFSRYDDSG